MFKTKIHGFIFIVSKMFYKSIRLFDSAIKLIICYYIINIFTLKLVYYTFFLYNFCLLYTSMAFFIIPTENLAAWKTL